MTESERCVRCGRFAPGQPPSADVTCRRCRMSAVEKFWMRVDRRGPDDCWEWQGAMNRYGYGRVYWPKRGPVLAHRVAYELEHGPIPEGLFVCHHCDNRRCVNELHLFLGTARDNALDMMAKGRWSCGVGKPFERLRPAEEVPVGTEEKPQ